MQKTLKTTVSFQGIGLHSGRSCRLVIKPGQCNQGIVFVRVDQLGQPSIPANYTQVVATQMSTVLERPSCLLATYGKPGAVRVGTVEHLLAAFFAAGIDNAIVEVDGEEVPILDGSSWEFYQTFQKAGLDIQPEPNMVLKILNRMEFRVGEKWALVEPAERFELKVSVEWSHPLIGYQEFFYQEGVTPSDSWLKARTFGFLSDLEALRKKGLALGASLDNAVGLDDSKILNPEGLRYSDEFVRHKALDAIGDLKLAGVRLQGRFTVHRGGHDFHLRLLRHIFEQSQSRMLVQDFELDAESYASFRTGLQCAAG